MKKEKIFIYGKHALVEALQNIPKAVEKVFLAAPDEEIGELAGRSGIPVAKLGDELTGPEKNASHQGVIGKISLGKLLLSYEDFISGLTVDKDTSLVFLGGLQDPHNVGAIIRSAAAFGVSGVIIPKNDQAPITGSVVKVSAGMAFRVPLISVDNAAEILKDLKARGFIIYGLDAKGDHPIKNEKFDTPSVFVFGNESVGLEKKLHDSCDTILSIPMNKRCESLNVAASAAIALYSWSLSRPTTLK